MFSLNSMIIILQLLLILSTASIIVQPNPEKAAATLTSSAILEQDEEELRALTFQNGFCGINPAPNSNKYVTEYVLPQTCEMPLGIDVDATEGIVWYVSTKKGVLGSYDIKEEKFNQERQIPSWPSRNDAREFSQVWEVEVDNRKKGEGEGDVWFADEKQNIIWRYIKSSNTFERYLVPGESRDFGTTYPTFIEFDSNDKNIIYFVGMFSTSIWIAEIDRLNNGTSEGISEVPIPIEEFEGNDPVFVTTGSLAFDDKRNSVWVSVMIYGYKGQIFQYDLDTESFDIFDLPRELNSPWGLTVDDNSDLWVTNAGSSIFYRLSPEEDNGGDSDDDDEDNESTNRDFEIDKFVTSKGSPRIFGKPPESTAELDFQNRYYTLPSSIKKSDDGSIWFNQQHGNKISKFNPQTQLLTEYWVPTQNRLWGSCSNEDDPISMNNNINNPNTCGIANVLQFSIGKDDKQIWFSEWSENKIGRVEAVEDPPFTIDVLESDRELTIERGEEEKIKLIVKAASDLPSSSINNLRMVASGTFTFSGDIGNSTGEFTEQSSLITIEEGEEEEVSFEFTPSADLLPGSYTLMIGAEDNSISYLKAIKIEII
jgi:virginiamycin B lyase